MRSNGILKSFKDFKWKIATPNKVILHDCAQNYSLIYRVNSKGKWVLNLIYDISNVTKKTL